jgi:hypothetical protein
MHQQTMNNHLKNMSAALIQHSFMPEETIYNAMTRIQINFQEFPIAHELPSLIS